MTYRVSLKRGTVEAGYTELIGLLDLDAETLPELAVKAARVIHVLEAPDRQAQDLPETVSTCAINAELDAPEGDEQAEELGGLIGSLTSRDQWESQVLDLHLDAKQVAEALLG